MSTILGLDALLLYTTSKVRYNTSSRFALCHEKLKYIVGNPTCVKEQLTVCCSSIDIDLTVMPLSEIVRNFSGYSEVFGSHIHPKIPTVLIYTNTLRNSSTLSGTVPSFGRKCPDFRCDLYWEWKSTFYSRLKKKMSRIDGTLQQVKILWNSSRKVKLFHLVSVFFKTSKICISSTPQNECP